jgi:hypothetical protein
MRDSQYPMAAPSDHPPRVRSYADPLIAVVIPCGPGHAQYLPAALDSLLGQTLRQWEVIVVNDGGAALDLAVYPFVRQTTTARPGSGPGAARNAGLEIARAPLVLFLDADDYLLPDALFEMTRAYVDSGKYIYTDWYGLNGSEMKGHETPDYQQMAWLERGQHAVTCLVETAHARGVGGFDARMKGWEDWDFFIKLAISGVCGQRVASPLLVYRQHTGTVREDSLKAKDELLGVLRDRYAAYVLGEKPMSSCCGGNADAILHAKRVLAEANGDLPWSAPPAQETLPMGTQEPAVVRMEFTGPQRGAVPYQGRVSGRTYYGANNSFDKFADVDPRDVDHLQSLGVWRVVQQPVVVAAPPPPPRAIEPVPPTTAERPMLDLTGDMAAEEAVNAQAAELVKKTRGRRA